MITQGKWEAKGTIIQGESGVTIAQVWPHTKLSSNESMKTMKANAERICLCVNLHDKLVEVIKDLISANQNARSLSLRGEPLRGMIWGEARSLLDVNRLKAIQALNNAGIS